MEASGDLEITIKGLAATVMQIGLGCGLFSKYSNPLSIHFIEYDFYVK